MVIFLVDFYFQVNTAMAPQLPHLSVQGDISAQVAQNLPHNTLADRALTTMSLAKHLNLLANCVIQGSTVKALGEFGQMDCAMKDFTALVGHGPSALEILVWRIMIMQQALLIVVIHPLNVSAQLGTRLQVQYQLSNRPLDKNEVKQILYLADSS